MLSRSYRLAALVARRNTILGVKRQMLARALCAATEPDHLRYALASNPRVTAHPSWNLSPPYPRLAEPR
jgi:hypothetical protein